LCGGLFGLFLSSVFEIEYFRHVLVNISTLRILLIGSKWFLFAKQIAEKQTLPQDILRAKNFRKQQQPNYLKFTK
jgi:hypothetical protein